MANILVTGGRGFIGTNLTNELRSRGNDVWTCDILQGEDPQHLKADVGVYQQMDVIFRRQKFDYVYHLAAEYGRWNGEDHYENLWRTNVIGTKNVLRLQEQHKFRMIFFSSAEVYGDYDELMSEDVMERVPIKQMNDYAISKWGGELQCLNHAAMFGNEVVRVRPVGCYGPHEYYSPYRGVIPILVYSALKGKKFTVHRGHKRIFDYVEDTCRTFANIAENFIPGEVYNVGGREDWVIDIEELAEIVLHETGADPELAEFKGEEGFTTRVKIVDFSKARRDLKHDPKIDVREGVRRYVDWSRKVYSV
ncbi:MAG TPA: nucleoside-diphosphate sugar epimerase [Blastocatellia bacterium]|nr:nucleoside-diphosphate sugar epimerase [Blastocatellia bacterium]